MTVYWTAKNQGTGSCGSTQQGVMWSTNSTISMSDTLLEKEYLGGLSPGQTTPEAHTITIPSSATPGSTYYIGIIADYDYEEDESNESNNDDGTPVAITINQQLPDLEPYQRSGWDDKLVISKVTGTTTSASTIYDDENVYVDYGCMNSGDGDAGHFRYGIYIDNVRRFYVDKTSLAAGYASYVLDSDIGVLSAGDHTFKVVCDYDGEVSESDEGNNEYSRVFHITARPEPIPTLISSGCYVTPTAINPGGRLTVYYRINNPSSSNLTVGLGCSIRKNGTGTWIDDSDDDVYKSCPPGESTQTRYFDVQSGVASGSYDVAWGLHRDFVQPMYDYLEKTNQFDVVRSDLALTNLTVSPSTITTSAFTACSFNIVNNGPTTLSSEGIMVDYYLSTNTVFGDGDDAKIGDTGFTVSIASGGTYPINLSPTGLNNMVDDWPADLFVGNYYVFATVIITDGTPVDPTSGNNHDRTNSTIFYNPPPEIRIEPLTINIDAEIGGAVSNQPLTTPSSNIKALDIFDPNSNLGEINSNEIIIRFRDEESANLHTQRVAYNLSDAQLLAATDTLGTESLPGELLGLQPFIAGAKKIQQIVSNNQSITETIVSGNLLSASEIASVSEDIKNNIEDYGPSGLFYAKIAQDSDIRNICIELMQREDVVYAHPSPVCHIEEAIPNDTLYNRMWNLERIGMPVAWDVSGNTLGNIRVCVIDTGVRISHDQLAGRTADETDVYLSNGDAYGDADPDNDDENGHGTKCAGIIGAIRDDNSLTAGIAPVTIIPVNAHSGGTSISNYTDGIYWGVDHGADVISLSFGSHRSSPYQSELDAAAYAENHGVIVCAAAGNEDGDADDHYPSAIPYYICVAAVDDDDERVTQPKWGWGSNFGDTVDLCAPGQGDVGASNDSILTLDRDSDSDWTNSFNGTSSATPHVAGVCALLAHVNPSLTAQEIRNIIQTTAEDQIGDPSEDVAGWDQFHGHGLINAASAIAMATHSFTIFNDGLGDLHIADIAQRDGDNWLVSWNPSIPPTISSGQSQIVTVSIDPELADIGSNDERLLVYSDDSDESPYPGGVYVNLTVTCVSTTIEQPPQDITICEGQDAVFDIVATGSEPLHYQWKKDSVDVGSDSPMLTLYNMQLADDGSEVWCEVTNACGSVVVSTSAFLTVLPWPTVTINPNPDQLNAAWILDGPNGYTYSSNGDETIADLEFGSYTITWSTIPSWNTPLPNPDPKNLSVGNSINFIGNYELIGDLYKDYYVDFKDLEILVMYWLTFEPSINMSGDDFIDFSDFAVFAEHWHEGLQ